MMVNLKKLILGISVMVLAVTGYGQQQFDGICSEVKIEILQELTLERIGFLATLEITNNVGDDPITHFSAELTFSTLSGADASDLFFVKPPEITGTNSIDGSGIIPPTQTAIVEWFIIPKIAAGGESPFGTQYKVGANLAANIYGSAIPDDVLAVIPDTITVRPEAQLDITYFQPRDVQGDDPFTPEVEAPIPFTVGVLVKNSGFGQANDLKIASQQPRIVENRNGLLLVARLLGSRVGDEPTGDDNLTILLGDIEPGRTKKGAWDMITSLSGEFVEFKASYTHDSDLGGEETSVITSLNAYFMNKEVLVDTAGQDAQKDFLADTDNDPQQLPNVIYTTDGDILPVNTLANAEVTSGGSGARTHINANVSVTANVSDWVYIRVDDPAQARFDIESIVRSDGKVLNENNYWTNVRFVRTTNERREYLNILDHVTVGDYTYAVTYSDIDDSVPPVTRIRFSGEAEERNNKHYVLRETQIFFTVDDDSPVTTVYSLDGGDFVPALPFTITEAGEHTIQYRSEDASGNTEALQIATVVIAAGRPGIDQFGTDHAEIFVTGSAYSIRPDAFRFQFRGQEHAPDLRAEIDIFAGVIGYPAIRNVPASPTTATVASLMVVGDNVDFYRYSLNGGPWSSEMSIESSIDLQELDGDVTVSVEGRSRYGSYTAAPVTAGWTINTDAAPTTIGGTPGNITREDDASLTVGGNAVSHYRYRLNNGFFHAERPVSEAINLGDLNGDITIDVVGKIDGTWQSEDSPTTVHWTVDRGYGLDFSSLTKVRSESFPEIGEELTDFVWNAITDNGAIAPPGSYTSRLTIFDSLDQTRSAVQVLKVGEVMAERDNVSQAQLAAERAPHAAGGWVVWQDQRDGNWDIYGRRVQCNMYIGNEIALTNSERNQENPKTDGNYVAWQGRQADGSWDIWIRDLTGGQAVAITATPEFDEIMPDIDWPWVVFQRRATGTTAPWQLVVYNVEDEQFSDVDPAAGDQVDADLFRNRLVWQDWRDAGTGEIYMKDLRTNDVRRITDSSEGQFWPVTAGQWIVWSDTRHVQNELYGFNLLRNVEVRLTDTPENETHPFILGKWVVYSEDSSGVPTTNLRVLNLSNLATVQLTNNVSEKRYPCMTSGRVAWQDTHDGVTRIQSGPLPNLQPVYNNRSPVVVTNDMVRFQGNAHQLLTLWNAQAQVTEISHYTSLAPLVVQTVTWENGGPVGENFDLVAGSFVWIRFRGGNVLDIGNGGTDPVDLLTGTNFVSACFFPDRFTSFRLLRDIGIDKVNSVRLLDSATGRWHTTSVVDNTIVGGNFEVPRVAVLMLDMNQDVYQWEPTAH